MKYRQKALLGILALSLPLSAIASGDGDLWIPLYAMSACMVQNPELSSTARGTELLKNPIFSLVVAAMKGQGASCFKSSHVLSPNLCATLINADRNTKVDKSLEQKYIKELSRLGDLRTCVEPAVVAQEKKRSAAH